jgi:type I restriction enzyme M protein
VRSDSQQIVQRLWSYCNILRDDGLSYPDYVEQLTYLLFLKMAHEQDIATSGREPLIPPAFNWQTLVTRSGEDLREHYVATLNELGKCNGMIGIIFRNAESKIRDPAKLRLLIVDLIDQRNWSALDIDVKGDAYEGLLEKNAQDTKSGAGQYFTPRPLVRAIVECIQPEIGKTVMDPACGTGGFLLAAHEYLRKTNPRLDQRQEKHLRLEALRGVELVDAVTRLGSMNLLLHGIGPVGQDGEPPIVTNDSISRIPERKFDFVITNPPFGKKSSISVVTGKHDRGEQTLSVLRPDFWVSTSNKELNFVQHVAQLLAERGRAAIVVPDGVLSTGGVGEVVRRQLLAEFDVHTLLRLPTGIFYATGVNANVLFFDRIPASEHRTNAGRKLWVYDLRTNMRFTLVSNRIKRSDLDEFVRCYCPGARHERQESWSAEAPNGRWRSFKVSEILKRDKCSLDVSWIEDEQQTNYRGAEALDDLAEQITQDLEAALVQLAELASGSKGKYDSKDN